MKRQNNDNWLYKPLKGGEPIISVEQAREILAEEAEQMSDEQVEKLIFDLDMMAQFSLEEARKQRVKEEAEQLAQLIYDIWTDKMHKT